MNYHELIEFQNAMDGTSAQVPSMSCTLKAYGFNKEVKRFGTLQPQSFHSARSWGNELE